MSPPERLINTFIAASSKPAVDIVSKIFIILGLVLGVNRLPLLGIVNKISLTAMSGLSLILNALLIFRTVVQFKSKKINYFIITDLSKFMICTILAYCFNSRLLNFYIELGNFDRDINFRERKSNYKKYLLNYFQILILMISCFSYYKLAHDLGIIVLLNLLPLKLFYYLEFNYHAHLFALVLRRICFVEDNLESSYSIGNNRHQFNICSKIVLKMNMKKILQFYNRMIIIYDYLYESIKWQMITSIILTFTNALGTSHNIVDLIIKNIYKDEIIWVNVSFLLLEIMPLFTICVFADKIRDEVRQLKDLLSRRLYGNTLDKPSRNSARTLLALTESHDLSFSLFHMFNVDITLPFKFCALLLTYLIIILQFNKVVNSN